MSATGRPQVVLTARRIDGDTFVRIGDVLAWLRAVEGDWAGCPAADPARVAEYLADLLRDTWMTADDPTIGGSA